MSPEKVPRQRGLVIVNKVERLEGELWELVSRIIEAAAVLGGVRGGVAYSISGYSSVTIGDSNTREGSISLFDGVSVKQIIGGGYVWVDPTGKLRIDTNLPTSETSGAVVGTQT